MRTVSLEEAQAQCRQAKPESALSSLAISPARAGSSCLELLRPGRYELQPRFNVAGMKQRENTGSTKKTQTVRCSNQQPT
jgi:hypothetical protein